MPVIWKPPISEVSSSFGEWDGAFFALVREISPGRWRAAVFPDGNTAHSMDAYVATEAMAKKFVERWAEVNHQRIAPPRGRHRMPHEGGY